MSKKKLFLIGSLMGIADLFPGISGGTVAYTLGIYENWLQAVESFSFHDLLSLRFKKLLLNIHWSFLFPLISGALISIVLFSHIVFWMLSDPITHVLFYSFIVVLLSFSSFSLMKEQPIAKISDKLFLPLGFIIALAITNLSASFSAHQTNSFLIISGSLAAFAMLLPGISGSMLLVLLGLYEPLIYNIKLFSQNLFLVQFSLAPIIFLSMLAIGILLGLKIFSSLILYLLKKQEAKTQYTLLGLMLGSLVEIWPKQFKISYLVFLLAIVLYLHLFRQRSPTKIF